MQVRNIFGLILILLNISGCASYKWVSTERPVSLLDRDYTNCLDFAYKNFPPNVSVSGITSQVYQANPYGYGKGHYQTQHQVISQDINKAPRENSLTKCMRENTWEWTRVD